MTGLRRAGKVGTAQWPGLAENRWQKLHLSAERSLILGWEPEKEQGTGNPDKLHRNLSLIEDGASFHGC